MNLKICYEDVKDENGYATDRSNEQEYGIGKDYAWHRDKINDIICDWKIMELDI